MKEIIMNEKLAYLLGYFYADGYIKDNKYKYPHLEIVKSDIDPIIYCLDELKIDYKLNFRFRKNSNKEQADISIYNREVKEIFVSILDNKLSMSHIKKYIKDEFFRFFLRGFFDGDGCINLSKKSSCRLYFYGSYDQDWGVLQGLLIELDINHIYQKISRKNGSHKSSHICISNKRGINILFEYLYPDRLYDYGLARKFEKLNTVKSLIKSDHEVHYTEQTAPILKIYT